MKTRHGTSNPGNTFFPTGKQSARNSARIDEDESDDRDRPVYPLPGLDNMTATTEHSNATTIVAADYPSPTPLSPRRSALPRRRTPSQTSTTVPLPLENSSTRSLTWTRCPSARKNRDLQIPRDHRYRNFWPICHPREELRHPLGIPRRCRMLPKMLRTSLSILSIVTKC